MEKASGWGKRASYSMGRFPVVAEVKCVYGCLMSKVVVEKSVRCSDRENSTPQSVLPHQWRQPRYEVSHRLDEKAFQKLLDTQPPTKFVLGMLKLQKDPHNPLDQNRAI
ncbi:hypothetical protein WN944_026530 [Citrus x changshan-huyou]|uniref:Uncharacterized protein n=1 Tax=Citrus x changshan-huyou TaxID=2935761 RepID=A0AAP0QCF1_9ROSI